MIIFIFLAVTTLLELYVLISVGEVIGALNTIMLVILTALIGGYLLRQQGWQTLGKAQFVISQGGVPAFELLEGAVLLISAILLLTPGFITDVFGLIGLMPWTRIWAIKHILNKYLAKTLKHKSAVLKRVKPNFGDENDVFEGEFWRD